MSQIFISHSSADNDKALAFQSWLRDKGWDDVFLDLDPKRGLVGGGSWQEQLKSAANRCEVVILLISESWADSKWCLAEFNTARLLSKLILPIVIDAVDFQLLPAELVAEHQLVDISSGPPFSDIALTKSGQEHSIEFSKQGLENVRLALHRSGLDPSYFDWPPSDDPERLPFRGLQPLQAEDAGIYFGRDGKLLSSLDQLRHIYESGSSRLLVVLGASGSGKSSFMRAGLLPRLRRLPQMFKVLDPLLPSSDPVHSEDSGLNGILKSYLKSVGISKSLNQIRSDLQNPDVGLSGALRELTELGQNTEAGSNTENARASAIILPIDQGEALFHPENKDACSDLLCEIGKALQQDSVQLIVLVTIRSDSYEVLQSADDLGAPQLELINLPPLAKGSYSEVIKGPVERWRKAAATGVRSKVSNALIDKLLADIERGGAKDALPLLAFTLQRLLKDCEGEPEIGLDHYQTLGGIRGAIDAAVEQVLEKAKALPAVPNDRAAQLLLLRRGFIPWLAGFDPETRTARRRVARYSEIPAESRPLIDLLVDERLLSTDVDQNTGEKTIEPAHEALLRQWGNLGGWIEDDQEELTAIDGVLRAVVEWTANNRDPQWLAHTAGRLETSEKAANRQDLADLLGPTDREYLQAARKAEDERRSKELTAVRRQLYLATAALAVMAIAAPLLWFFWSNAENARRMEAEQKVAAESSTNIAFAKLAQADGNEVEAARYAFKAFSQRNTVEARSAAISAALAISPHLRSEHKLGRSDLASFEWTGPTTLRIVWQDGQVESLDTATGRRRPLFQVKDIDISDWQTRLADIQFGINDEIVALRLDGNPVFSNTTNNENSAELLEPTNPVQSGNNRVARNGDKTDWVYIAADNTIQRLVCHRDRPLKVCRRASYAPSGDEGFATALEIDPGGSYAVVAFENGQIIQLDIKNLDKIGADSVTFQPLALAFHSTTSNQLLISGQAGEIAEVTWRDGAIVSKDSYVISENPIPMLTSHPNKRVHAASCDSLVICILPTATKERSEYSSKVLTRFVGHDAPITAMKWSPDGSHLVSLDAEGAVRTWSFQGRGGAHSILFSNETAELSVVSTKGDGTLIAAGSSNGTSFVWRLPSGGETLSRIPAPQHIVAPVVDLDWSPDGQDSFAIAYRDFGIGVTEQIADEGNYSLSYQPMVGAHRVAHLGGTRVAALTGQFPGLKIWSAATEAVASLPPDKSIRSLPYGLQVLSADEVVTSQTDGSLLSYDVVRNAFTGQAEAIPSGGRQKPNGAGSIAYMPEGNTIAVSNRPGEIGIYDLDDKTSAALHLPNGSRLEIMAIGYSPDRSYFAALDAIGNLTVWRWSEGTPEIHLDVSTPALSGPNSGTHAVVGKANWFSWVDNSTLALATASGVVHLTSVNIEMWRDQFDGLF
ncbi:TIR domain-containing protein [Roseibium alexandrii]